jgi:hypothetical protein
MKIDDEDKVDQSYFSPDFKCIINLFAVFKKDIAILFVLLML